MERNTKFCFKCPVAPDFLHRRKQEDLFAVVVVVFFLRPFYFSYPLSSPSGASMRGNFSTATSVSLQISDPLYERTIATSSFNLILHPNPVPAEKLVPPVSQGQSSGT